MDTEVRRTRRDDRDGPWTGLSHEEALRLEGRRFRPGKVYDRPRESERATDGNPSDAATKAEAEGRAKMNALFRRYGWRIQGGKR